MLRSIFVCASLVVLLTTTGCTMCMHPYDYAGPVYSAPDDCGCNGGHGWHSRVGSILDGSQISTEELSDTPTPAPQPTPAKKQVSKPMSSPNASARYSPRPNNAYSYKRNPREYREQLASYNAYGQGFEQPRARSQVRPQPNQMQGRQQSAMQARSQGRPQGQMLARTQPMQSRMSKRVYAGEVPGSERLISTSDRVVSKSQQFAGTTPMLAASSEPALATEGASPALSDSAEQLPVSGWTARRSTTEVLR